MNLSDRQYERIARYMDGEAVELDAEELAAAELIGRQERQLGRLLDARVPPETLADAEVRLAAAIAPRRKRPLRYAYYAAAVAAAALVLVVVNLPHGPAPQPVAEIPAEVLFEGYNAPAEETELTSIAQEIDRLDEQLATSTPPMPHEAFLLDWQTNADAPDATRVDEPEGDQSSRLRSISGNDEEIHV